MVGDGLEDISRQVTMPSYYYSIINSRPRTVTFKMSEDELERLDHAAKLLNMSRSELIRKAINDFIYRLFKAEEDSLG